MMELKIMNTTRTRYWPSLLHANRNLSRENWMVSCDAQTMT